MSNEKAAELLAAVRAVESGERSADSFFTEPRKPAAPARRPTAPGAAPPRTAPDAARPQGAPPGAAPGAGRTGGPVAVPGGLTAVPGAPAAVPEEVRALLAEGGAPEALGRPVTDALGEHAADPLRADPWQLLAVPGVRPEQADGFARALLGAEATPGDARRAVALVVHLLERAALRGDTVLEPSALAEGLSRHAVPDPEEAVREAVDAGAVLVFEDALDAGPAPSAAGAARPAAGEEADPDEERPVRLLVGLDRYALAEESLADGLARVATTFAPGADSGTDPDSSGQGPERAPGPPGSPAGTDLAERGAERGAERWDAAAESAPSPSAGELIRTVAGSGLVTHTGGEASRAEIAALVAAATRLGLRAWALTHTDDGRARMAQLVESATPADGDGTKRAGGASDAAGGPADPAGNASDPSGGPADPAGAGADATGDEPDAGAAGADSAGAGPDAADRDGDGSDAPVEANGAGCATVAGVLAGTEGPERDAEGALAVDLLAVCDAPQLDAETAAALLESLPDGVRLVLSGDPNVLGSAGPGQVFRDLVAARYCPHVASRTPDPGPVGELVSGIGIGELNQVEAPAKEVVIVPVGDAGEAVHRTVQLVADSVPRAIGVPTEETQVITPGHGGSAGTRALNAALKERLNPGPGRFAGFDPGDRIAHSPAPGRTSVGTVISADDRGLHLACAGREVTVPPDRVSETVRHGWAVTAHQAAGLRWPAAVVVLPGDATGALSREWVYTAFGRGERHLSVVHGAGDALPRAVASGPGRERTTRLRTLLTESARAAQAAAASAETAEGREGPGM